MTDLPAPLVPAGVDLRDFHWMAIDTVRLFGSEFHARSDDTVWRAGVTLWLRCYNQQVPAASIPDDDIAMARLAELGRDVKTWREIKDAVLRGWVRCSDGRLYHPVVAEKALEAWIEKLMLRKASAAGNAKRHGLAFDPAPIEAAIADSLARLAALNPNSRTLSKRLPRGAAKAPTGTSDEVPPGAETAPTGTENGSHPAPGGTPDSSHRDSDEPPGGSPDGTENGSHPAPRGQDRTGHIPPIVPLTGDSSPADRAPRGTAKGGVLPGDWGPKPAHYEAAAKLGRDAAWVDDEAEGLRAWTQAEAHRSITRKANWDQAFHNRIRENARRGAPLLRPIQGGASQASPVQPGTGGALTGRASASVGIAATIAARRGDHR